jgi:putative intracellular protease/amidase
MNLLENTKKVSDFSSGDFDAIVVVSGQGPMFTFKQETDLQNKFLEFYNKGKVSAALCHGSSLLLYLKDKDGNLITGQQQHSGAEVAKLVIGSLGK